MAIFKCKMCGGNLEIQEGVTVATCEYCGTQQTVPSANDEKKTNLFNRANKLRLASEFDRASGVYESIVAEFPEEAEAYWGLCLCKYGIEYVDDPRTAEKIPTCHRASFESILNDPSYRSALSYADPMAKAVYEAEAKAIDLLQRDILNIVRNEKPFDVFICYKETDEQGNRTLDSVLAQDIYDVLTDKGFKVFFARITLEDKLGQEYEPYIFAALNSAKVMLVFGTDYEYFNAVWVKNEWARFLELMAKDKSRHLIPCYKDIDAYDMPKEFKALQAQDMGKVGAVQDLLRGLDKLIAPATATAPSSSSSADVTELLAMGNEALEQGEWEIASRRFDLALVADPKCAEAYLGKLMVERKCNKREKLAKSKKSLKKSSRFKELMAYADDALKQELETYQTEIKKRIKKRSLAFVLSVFVILASAITATEVTYQKTIKDCQSGRLSAEDTYAKLSSLSWYKKDEGMLLLSAAGKGDWETADTYHCEDLFLTPATAKWLEGDYTFTYNTVERVTFSGDTETIVACNLKIFPGLKEVTIPEGVTEIGAYAFNNCADLTSITIPESVTNIDSNAFNGCAGLTDIVIPDGVTSIGAAIFSGCTSLTSVTIPESVTVLGHNVFQNCTELTSITIPESVTTIGSSAFNGCKSLTSITIPDSVTALGHNVFWGCEKLTSITIPESVTAIGSSAFRDSGLTTITIPGHITKIEASTFSGCTSLTSVTIPNSVTSIGGYAFQGCSNLTSITIPDNVTTIGGSAFKNCFRLTSITIPDSVTNIGGSEYSGNFAFEGCSSLKDVWYAGSEADRHHISMELYEPEKNVFLNANWHYNS